MGIERLGEGQFHVAFKTHFTASFSAFTASTDRCNSASKLFGPSSPKSCTNPYRHAQEQKSIVWFRPSIC
jgi:hypothetical protein